MKSVQAIFIDDLDEFDIIISHMTIEKEKTGTSKKIL